MRQALLGNALILQTAEDAQDPLCRARCQPHVISTSCALFDWPPSVGREARGPELVGLALACSCHGKRSRLGASGAWRRLCSTSSCRAPTSPPCAGTPECS